MESLTTAEEIVALTIDLPVYMLEQMKRPDAAVLEGLISFLDFRMELAEDADTFWDLRIGNALAIIATAQHPDALVLCCEAYNWSEDASPYLQNKILRLIETSLEPARYQVMAHRWLKSLRKGQDLHLPLSILIAKSGHIGEELKDIILDYWKNEPAIGAHLMGLSKNDVFLELIERELVWLAPFVRYLPMTDETRTRLVEHDMWAEMAEAWFAIAHHNRPTPAWLNPTFLVSKAEDAETVLIRHREWQEHLDHHLMETFGGTLSQTPEEWLQMLGSAPEFNRWRTRFIEAQQLYVDGRIGPSRGLRLVQTTES